MACKTLSGLLRSISRMDDSDHEAMFMRNLKMRDYMEGALDQPPSQNKDAVVNDLSRRLAGQPGFDNTRTFTQAVNGELVDYTEAKRKANDMLAAWTKTTYHDIDSAGTQRAARLAFSLDDARQVAPESDAELNARLTRSGYLSLDDRTRLLRAQYAATQEALGKAGIGPDDYVTLYRGIALPVGSQPPTLKGMAEGDVRSIQFKSNPLSSWTTDPGTAEVFAQGSTKSQGDDSFLMRVAVPRSRIVSTARTGLGSTGEYEAVVMDTPGEVEMLKVRSGGNGQGHWPATSNDEIKYRQFVSANRLVEGT